MTSTIAYYSLPKFTDVAQSNKVTRLSTDSLGLRLPSSTSSGPFIQISPMSQRSSLNSSTAPIAVSAAATACSTNNSQPVIAALAAVAGQLSSGGAPTLLLSSTPSTTSTVTAVPTTTTTTPPEQPIFIAPTASRGLPGNFSFGKHLLVFALKLWVSSHPAFKCLCI